jgi:peroxiredoxin
MKVGDAMPRIRLPAVDGGTFDTQSLKGQRYLVTFFRFASCPFCNLRISQLIRAKEDFGDAFEIVAIFESEIEHLKKHADKHVRKFPILADEKRKYYELFGVRKSVSGFLKGIVFRFPTALKAMLQGYWPHEVSSRALTMPLSILVDENGIIRTIYHGKDEGDHLQLETIADFATG